MKLYLGKLMIYQRAYEQKTKILAIHLQKVQYLVKHLHNIQCNKNHPESAETKQGKKKTEKNEVTAIFKMTILTHNVSGLNKKDR